MDIVKTCRPARRHICQKPHEAGRQTKRGRSRTEENNQSQRGHRAESEETMLKSNCKIVHERIRAYILSAENVAEFAPEAPNETYNDKARAIFAYFMEYYNGDNRNKGSRPMNLQEAFHEWTGGLPAIIDTCYRYNTPAVEMLGDILEETAEERARYSECDAERMLSYLIYRELYHEAMKPEKVKA